MTPSSEAFTIMCLENYYNNIQDVADNSSEVCKPLLTAKELGAKRNQGWTKEGLTRFEYYCKAVATNRAVTNLAKVDVEYREAKWAEVSKEEERKRKREETRENRERGWQVAYVDDWSDGETTQEPEKQPQQPANQDEGSDGEESVTD
jgi:hypothetical protein